MVTFCPVLIFLYFSPRRKAIPSVGLLWHVRGCAHVCVCVEGGGGVVCVVCGVVLVYVCMCSCVLVYVCLCVYACVLLVLLCVQLSFIVCLCLCDRVYVCCFLACVSSHICIQMTMYTYIYTPSYAHIRK